ncbi:MAG: 6-bladed beta-propeller [Mangrovibacterium sp.]
MKMRIRYLLGMIMSMFLVNCQKQNNTQNSLTRFDIEDINKTSRVWLSQLNIKNIQYVPLETDSNFLISEIKKLVATDSTLVIFDYNTNFFQFDFAGNFINKIGTIGKGPQEYQFSFDFTIDNEKKQIFIPMMTEPKLIIYSLNGKFIKSIPFPKYARNVFHMDEGILCRCDYFGGKYDGGNSIFLTDYDGNVVKAFPDKYKYKNMKMTNAFEEEFLTFSYDKKLYTKEIYSDTVFIFKHLKFQPAFILDHGGKTLSVEAREEIDSFDSFTEISAQYSKETNLLLFGNYVFSEFSYHNRFYNFIGSFDDKDFRVITEDKIINDLDGGPDILFKTASDKNTVIGWINAFDLKAHVASENFKNSSPKYPEKKKELEKLANNLKENDNPVLMLIKLKK